MIPKETLTEYLHAAGIPAAGTVPFSACKIQKQHLLTFPAKTALMFLIPYYVPTGEHNLSLYAVAGDYHYYLRGFFDRILPTLHEAFPDASFAGFTDHSPIDEREAAAKAGLGIFGDNGLLIHPRYGTFHFIGEILTDLETDAEVHEIGHCEHCGRCRTACPTPGDCLSALTQKKGVLTAEEEATILRHGSCWGCDACQNCCPHNRNIEETPIDFFHRDRIPILTSERLDAMSDEFFATRAYAWRGRAVIARNLALFERD